MRTNIIMPSARLAAAAAAAAWSSLTRRVPTVEEDPLAASDADEVDDEEEAVVEDEDDEDVYEDAQEEGGGEEQDDVERAELDDVEEHDDYDVLHEFLDAEEEAGDEEDDEDGVEDDEHGSSGKRRRAAASSSAVNTDTQTHTHTFPPPTPCGPDLPAPSGAGVTEPTVGGTQKGRKKSKKADLIVPAERKVKLVYFFLDIETTSNARKQYDRIIELAVVAFSHSGVELGRWEQRFLNASPVGKGLVPISDVAFSKHRISAEMLKGKPQFKERAPALVAFFEEHLKTAEAGVLGAHNGDSCDFRFLGVEMARAGATWPTKIKYTLDTYLSINRFKSLDYHKVGADASKWPTRTDTGKASMAVEPVVDYIVKVRGAFGKPADPLATFRSVCGNAHEACADAVGAAAMWFDVAPNVETLQSKWSNGLFRPMSVWVDIGKELLAKPLVTHEAMPSGWEEESVAPPRPPSAATGDDQVPQQAPTKEEVKAASAAAATAVKPKFTERQPPGPSPFFLNYLLRCARGASGLPTADGMGLCGLQSELMLVGVHARLGPPEPMPAEGGGAAVCTDSGGGACYRASASGVSGDRGGPVAAHGAVRRRLESCPT